MRLNHNIHLGYCTNIHRGETWEETFASLNTHTLAVRNQVCPDQAYGIGLRLGYEAAKELARPGQLSAFQKWLTNHDCYVFTINGFPYGQFHGTRVKEQVYLPDWTSDERVVYTNSLFDILAEIAPHTSGGSVSTVPGSFKEFITSRDQVDRMRVNVSRCAEHIDALCQSSGKDLHLGMEPEPLCWFETTDETIEFFEPLDSATKQRVGVNYDTCHLAVEFEDAATSLQKLSDAGIRISKLHLSSALSLEPTPDALERLAAFTEDVYFHQVVERHPAAGVPDKLVRYRDLPDALAKAKAEPGAVGDEWRVHFHVPVHAQPELLFGDTRGQIIGVLDVLKKLPTLCRHMEIETYTWEVLPRELRSANVVDQLVNEYDWCLSELRARDLA
ncbi:MAG: metabolite traffic protein EboE [Verrucomicrobiae bacterium]|nr:metabolite traffic protein EboE [Verrucomicrobiae bacterium]